MITFLNQQTTVLVLVFFFRSKLLTERHLLRQQISRATGCSHFQDLRERLRWLFFCFVLFVFLNHADVISVCVRNSLFICIMKETRDGMWSQKYICQTLFVCFRPLTPQLFILFSFFRYSSFCLVNSLKHSQRMHNHSRRTAIASGVSGFWADGRQFYLFIYFFQLLFALLTTV